MVRRRPLVLRQHQRARPAVLRSLRVRHRRLRPEALLSQHRGLFPRPDLPRQALPRARAPADLERRRRLPARPKGRHDDAHHEAHRPDQLLASGVHAGRQGSPDHLRQRSGVRRPPVSRHRHGPADHRVRAALGHPRRRLLEGREVSDRRRQRGLPTRRPPARCGHAEAGRAAGDAARPGARHRALG